MNKQQTAAGQKMHKIGTTDIYGTTRTEPPPSSHPWYRHYNEHRHSRHNRTSLVHAHPSTSTFFYLRKTKKERVGIGGDRAVDGGGNKMINIGQRWHDD